MRQEEQTSVAHSNFECATLVKGGAVVFKKDGDYSSLLSSRSISSIMT